MMTSRPLAAIRARLGSRHDDERGAYAILMSMMLVMLIGLAAIAVDIASQVASKQQLRDTMDAAAHAAAWELPSNGSQAIAVARSTAIANDPDATVDADLFCVVGSKDQGGTWVVQSLHIPSTCYPGAAPYTEATYPGLSCNESICAIPCRVGAGTQCNTIRVWDSKDVDYAFAPAIGFDRGSTGAVVSVACKGACGAEAPNPLDVVVMGDRTASMESDDRALMKQAILSTLTTMSPSLHHVAFGALHKSRTDGFTHSAQFQRPLAPVEPTYETCTGSKNSTTYRNCTSRNTAKKDAYEAQKAEWERTESAFAKTTGWDGSGDTNGDGRCMTEAVRTKGRSAADTRSEGTWVPVPFANDYLTEDGELNPRSLLVDSISCLGESASGEYGTHLAGALKGAARHLLYGPRLAGAETRPGTPRKVLIFETDGMPDEVGTPPRESAETLKLTNDSDVFGGQQSNTSDRSNWVAAAGTRSCNNFTQVAKNAKEAGILIITVAFADARSATCERYYDFSGEKKVRDVLAEAASPSTTGGASRANDCANDASVQAENTDGDYYFCAASGNDLAEIFRTALNQVSDGIKLIRLPS